MKYLYFVYFFSLFPFLSKAQTNTLKVKKQNISYDTISSKIYNAEGLIATIGGKNGGSIKTSTFMAQGGIIIETNNNFPIKARITSYAIYIIKAGLGEEYIASGIDERFPTKFQKIIGSLRPGDIVNFKNILIKYADGTKSDVDDIAFLLE